VVAPDLLLRPDDLLRAPIGEGETTLAPEVEAQVIALISAGRKIEAIKVVKDATRMGLKDSKDLVEALERD
jgi:ribosomal protein L7/L12